MKCRLEDNERCDENFQIEFNSLKELKKLKASLYGMIKYAEICIKAGEECPPLVYKINKNYSSIKNKKDDKS